MKSEKSSYALLNINLHKLDHSIMNMEPKEVPCDLKVFYAIDVFAKVCITPMFESMLLQFQIAPIKLGEAVGSYTLSGTY
jgi:hypothetical protein